MGQVRVEMGIFDSTGNINSVTVPSPNNASSFKGGNYNASSISTRTKGQNVFIVNSSKVGQGGVFSSSYNGFISNIMSSDTPNATTGNYAIDNFIMTINGSGITKFVIFFDTVVNQYATKLSINNTIILNDDTTFVYYTNSPADEITIQFIEWNTPKSPVRFVALKLDLSLSYTKENGLIEVIRGSQKETNISAKPAYGVISQYGSLKIYDYDSELEDLADLNLLTSKIPIKIFLDNNIIGEYTSSNNWIKDNNDIVSITLEDELIYWSDKFLPDVPLQIGTKTAKDLLTYLITQSYEFDTENVDLFNNKYFDIPSQFVEWCNSIKIYYYYIKSDTLLNTWNAFCDITQSKVYKLPNGKTTVRRE